MTIFCNSSEDVSWLKETHLKNGVHEFASFILYGNEDYPDRIDLYLSSDPMYTDPPLVLTRDKNGDLVYTPELSRI
jgi:hypothetical protein